MTKITKTNPFILTKKSPSVSLEEEYDHEEFKQWLTDLPIGNISETARALHHELKRHSSLDISPLERYEAVQLMLPALGLLLEKIRTHLATKPIPLSGDSKLIAKLHLELLVGIVVAYKAVLSQLHDESFTSHLLHKHTRAEALRRALYFLGEILLYEYSAYATSPKYVWQEIHGFHHYAVINDLRLRDKDIDVDGIVGDLSIDDIYKRIQLLALADAGGLLRGEIKRINETLPDWLSEVSLIPVGQEVSSYPVFVIDITRDAPPYVANESDLKSVKTGWVLVVDKLDQVLKKKLDQIKQRSKGRLRPVDLVPATLYSKLRKRWLPDVVAREERSEGQGTISVTCGLESLYWLFGGWKLRQDLDGDLRMDAGQEEEPMYDKPTLAVEQDEFLINVDAELYAAIAAESGHVEKLEEPERDKQEDRKDKPDTEAIKTEPMEEECVCVNQSGKGYCLAWSGESEYKAHVGELVGIKSSGGRGSDSLWRLGVIRWMRVQSNGLMGFGIELFEGDLQAIQLDCQHVEPVEDLIIGFLQKRNGSVETLITKPFFYGDKDKLLLTSADGRIPVVPGDIVECTDAFMRFKVRFDSGIVEMNENRPTSQSKAENIFNNLWDDL
jgi:hypothetical protein